MMRFLDAIVFMAVTLSIGALVPQVFHFEDVAVQISAFVLLLGMPYLLISFGSKLLTSSSKTNRSNGCE